MPANPGRARRELRAMLESADWPGDVDGVLLAVHEALMNSRDHGGGATAATAELDRSSLVVEVWDEGPGFDPRQFTRLPPDPLSIRGRGVWLMSQIATSCEVRHRAASTCVRLVFDGEASDDVQAPLGKRTAL